VAKLSLETSAKVRDVLGSTQLTLIASDQDPVIKVMTSAGAAYFNSKRAGPSAGSSPSTSSTSAFAGSPHLYVWAACCLGILKRAELYGGTDLEPLRSHTEATTSTASLAGTVHICRVSKAFEAGKVRVSIATSPSLSPVAEVICRCLVAQGASQKYGAPPRSHFERVVGDLLKK
jgi:hypothetical protein